MAFSYSLYLDYGNTFGIVGGESKFPTLHGLTQPVHYAKLVYMTVQWGLCPLGVVCVVIPSAASKTHHTHHCPCRRLSDFDSGADALHG